MPENPYEAPKEGRLSLWRYLNPSPGSREWWISFAVLFVVVLAFFVSLFPLNYFLACRV